MCSSRETKFSFLFLQEELPCPDDDGLVQDERIEYVGGSSDVEDDAPLLLDENWFVDDDEEEVVTDSNNNVDVAVGGQYVSREQTK